MGIIQRQTIRGTILTYLGIVVGFITTALIFPRILTPDEIGLLGILVSYSFIFGQMASLGTSRIIIVMFPYFRDKERHHHGFFSLMSMICGIGLLLALATIFLIRPWLVSNANDSSTLFAQYVNYLVPLTVFTLLFYLFDSFSKVLYNATLGILLKEFVQRVFILGFIMLFYYHLVDFGQYVALYVLATGIPVFALFIFLLKEKEIHIRPTVSKLSPEQRKLMGSLGFYGILIGFSGMVILNIDRIMVERMMGLGPTGIYTTMAYFATLIIIPSRALLKISDPVIAQSWKDSDMKNLEDIYYRSSLNQFIIGCLLLAGIWGNIGNILRILPPEFGAGHWVVLLIGLAFLSDMATGASTYILANSAYFKYQTYFTLLLIVFVIFTNYLLIPVWGITGAAVATLLSKLANNYMRFQFLYSKYRLQPYDMKYVYTILIMVIAYVPSFFMPQVDNLYLDLAVRSVMIGGIFMTLTLIFRLSDDIQEKYYWFLGIMRGRGR